MPKTPINYSNTIMYKLCCKDTNIKDEYVGHTTNKTRRKQDHKDCCNNPNSKKYNRYVYQFIREHGGWENWSMVVIEEHPCENRNKAETRERYWIETLQATLNKVIPTRTDKEWYEENKEELLKYQQQYREQNREEIKEKKNQKINCECGGKYTNCHKSRHMKSKKHTDYLNTLLVKV